MVRNPAERPLSLSLDTGDSLDRVEEEFALSRVFNVRVNEKRVGLRVYVLPKNIRSEAIITT